jgi:hypothetical protein
MRVDLPRRFEAREMDLKATVREVRWGAATVDRWFNVPLGVVGTLWATVNLRELW